MDLRAGLAGRERRRLLGQDVAVEHFHDDRRRMQNLMTPEGLAAIL
jgi:hypothetical protein